MTIATRAYWILECVKFKGIVGDHSHHKPKTSLLKKIHKNVTNKSFQKDWGLENIYLWRKVVCLFVLFCLYLWDPPNQGASDRVLGLFGKLSTRRVAWAWFHDFWTCRAKVLEYWMISSLKMKLSLSFFF